jgi:hypothetical protein
MRGSRLIPTVLGMVCLVTGFALLRPALGFICAGVLLLTPLFLNRKG